MKSIHSEVLNQVISLYQGYSEVQRTTTQPYKLAVVKKAVPDYRYHPDDPLIREPLIEHVGSLPIVAVALFPHLDNPAVDLGRALTMLAIHDIGELGAGDEMAFNKRRDGSSGEREYARELLHHSYHELYLEVEDRTSKTARFAKSVDKITPDIVDLITPPEITVERFRFFLNKEPKEIVPLIKEYKHPYMVWNEFLTQLHLEILRRLDAKLSVFY